ncbi:MAG: hypothetical protein WCT19_01125 [Candidatus Paceibacterota bacterium]|jgi:hypothetical protein
MVLDILASLTQKLNIESCAGFDTDLPVQPNDIELGVLSGQALSLWVYIAGKLFDEISNKQAEVLEARAADLRSRSKVESTITKKEVSELVVLQTRRDQLKKLLALELCEQFGIDPGWSVSLRQGFKVVKRKEPLNFENRVILEFID